MRIFSADTSDFLVTAIFLEEGIIHFSGNLSTITDLAINFDLWKCITRNKHSYLNYNGKVYSRDTEASWCHFYFYILSYMQPLGLIS